MRSLDPPMLHSGILPLVSSHQRYVLDSLPSTCSESSRVSICVPLCSGSQKRLMPIKATSLFLQRPIVGNSLPYEEFRQQICWQHIPGRSGVCLLMPQSCPRWKSPRCGQCQRYPSSRSKVSVVGGRRQSRSPKAQPN